MPKTPETPIPQASNNSIYTERHGPVSGADILKSTVKLGTSHARKEGRKGVKPPETASIFETGKGEKIPFHLAKPLEASGKNGEHKETWEERNDTYKDASGTWRPDSVKVD